MTYALSRKPIGFLGKDEDLSAAGPINGVGLLLRDLRDIAERGSSFMQPDFEFSMRRFKAMMETFRSREGEDQDETVERVRQRYAEMSGEEIQTLVAGVIGSIAEGVVRATAVSSLKVSTPSERATNHALQATIIDPARLQWNMLSQMISNMEARRDRGTSGLGVAPLVVAALVVGGAILGTAGIIAGTFLADSWTRMNVAAGAARDICHRGGGCTPEQEAHIRQQLQLGPFDEAFRAAGESAGAGLGTAITIVGVGGAALVAGAIWYYAFDGREWIQEKFAERRRSA